MEQMQILLAILVLLPFVSALLLALCGSDRMRRLIVYGSAGVLMISAVAFAVCFFSGENLQLRFLQSGGIIDHTMLALEAGFAVLITVLSIKYRRYYVAVLSIVQTVLTFVYELGGYKPAVQPYNLFADQLTVIMVLIIAVVGTLITVYAVGYMRDYHNHHKEYTDRRRFFFAMLYVFLGAMFGLVLSNSLLWLYFFWEITSLVSFLLIGYTRTKEAVQNSFRALWMNLLGGLGFAAAIFWAGVRFGITDLQSLILCDGKLVVAPGDFAGLCRTDQERTIAFLPLAAGSHGGTHALLCTVAQRHDGKSRCVPANPPGAGDVRHLCRLYGEPGRGLYIPDHFHAGHYRQ